MSITLIQCILAFSVLAWMLLLWALFSFVINKYYAEIKHSDSFVIGFTILSVTLILQLYGLSMVPVDRPLDYLWIIQLFILILLIIFIDWKDFLKYLTLLKVLFYDFCRDLDLLSKIMVFVPIILLLNYFFFGIFMNPGGMDAFTYHIPIAIQPFQDGFIGRFDSQIPWTYLYPKGVELLWSWTILLNKSDLLFHTINLLFGIQLLLAVWSVGRYLGLRISQAIIPVMIIVAMPIFFTLVTTGYNDLAYSAQVISLIAILIHKPKNGEDFILRILFSCIILSLSMLIKYPVLAGVVFLMGVIYQICQVDILTINKKLFKKHIGLILMVFGIMLFSLSLYLNNTFEYHNPMYPLEVSIADNVILPGLVDTSKFGLNVGTVMGSISQMNFYERFYIVWIDTFTGWNQNSAGGYGIAFLSSIVFYWIFIFSKKTYKRESTLFLAIVSLLLFLVPAMFLPRYGMPLASIMLISAVIVISKLPTDARRGAKIVVYILILIGSFQVLHHLNGTLSWLRSQSDGTLSWYKRSYFIYEKINQNGYPGWIKADAVKLLHERSNDSDVIVWNDELAPAFLWNRDYSNKIMFLPTSSNERYPYVEGDHGPMEQEKKDWIMKIRKLQPKHIVTQNNSLVYDIVKSMGGYSVIYSDNTESESNVYFIFEKNI